MAKNTKFRDAIVAGVAYDLAMFLAAFFLMFALALVRKDVHSLPAIGYWGSFGLVWATSITGGLLRGMPKDTK